MATATSRGWGKPSESYRSKYIVRLQVAGVTLYVHRELAPLMGMFLAELNQHYKLVPGWCWGYAHRKIRGSLTRWSNHAWGLAVDINAPKNGMSNTLVTDMPVPLVRTLAKKYGLRWGGDYKGRKDAMHFEWEGTPAELRALTAELLHKKGATTKKSWNNMTPEEKQLHLASAQGKKELAAKRKNPYAPPNFAIPFGKGSKGSKVQWVQWALGLKEDGDYGPGTEAAVKAFQKKLKFKPEHQDGIVGWATGKHLAAITR